MNSMNTTTDLFSSYFEGLARRTLEGLWLEDIHIQEGGQSIKLVGGTYQAKLIPKWLKTLKKEPAFQGITFQSATLGKKSDDGDSLRFSLLTHRETTADKTQ